MQETKIRAIRYFPAVIICGPHRGSLAVQDHLRSNLGIISGLGIICGRGSFAALYNHRLVCRHDETTNKTRHTSLQIYEQTGSKSQVKLNLATVKGCPL